MTEYTHPGKPEHVMSVYRAHVLGSKRKWSRQRTEEDGDRRVPQRGARQLIHYRPIVEEYLAAKQVVLAQRRGDSRS